MKRLSVAVLGGDHREIRVAELLKEGGHRVSIFGSDPAALNGMSNTSSAEEAIAGSDWIVCPAPGLGRNDEVYAPSSPSPIFLDEALLGLSGADTGGLVVGRASSTLTAVSERLQIQVFEMKHDRALAIVVASAVAEGLLEVLVSKTTRLFRELGILVLGYGATGSAIADTTVALGCRTTVASRNRENLETARRRGATPVPFSEWQGVIQTIDVIINTVPQPETIGPHVFPALAGKTVIDISSPPGGLDHSNAQELGVTVIWARGLAGQRAPLTIGEAQHEFIRLAMASSQSSVAKGAI